MDRTIALNQANQERMQEEPMSTRAYRWQRTLHEAARLAREAVA